MIYQICSLFENKRILILGFGREGKSTYHFIRRHFPNQCIGIYDRNGVKGTLTNVNIHTEDDYEELLIEYDLIMKSPGIVLKVSDPKLLNKCTSQTDLFLRFYHTQTIGITGTKGKSTTSSLLYHILTQGGKDAILVGNIGVPVFDTLEKIGAETLVVFELSSHQLEYVTHSPHYGVLLNIFEEHLDHYGSFDKYKQAKENIYKYQQEGDILLYNPKYYSVLDRCKSTTITIANDTDDRDDRNEVDMSCSVRNRENISEKHKENLIEMPKENPKENLKENPKENLKGNPKENDKENDEKKFSGDVVSRFSSNVDVWIKGNEIYYEDKWLVIDENKINLMGNHNIYNIAVTYTIAKAYGMEDDLFLESIHTFLPLPHRMEYVTELNGVKYYNDSISTICETTMNNVNCVDNVDTVILGGMDRGINYQPLVDFLIESDINHIILMPDTGYRIHKLLLECVNRREDQKLFVVSGIEEAVEVAKRETTKGTTCLFSPAAASYGFFKNFEERGEVFKRLILS